MNDTAVGSFIHSHSRKGMNEPAVNERTNALLIHRFKEAAGANVYSRIAILLDELKG
jgi:hypothetical protein